MLNVKNTELTVMVIVAVGLAAAPNDSLGNPGQDRSRAYWGAVAYLKTQGAPIGWEGEAAQGVLLGEAIGAYPQVAGPRSTSLLSSLQLASLDARGRRAATLSPLGLNVRADREALLVELRRPWPLLNPGRGYGESGTRLPSSLDNALALRGLGMSGGVTSQEDANAVGAAAIYLVGQQIPPGQPGAGAWPRIDRGDAEGSGNSGMSPDVTVTAQAVLALTSWNFQPPPTQVLDAAANYLKAAAPTGAAERALRLLALLAVDPGASEAETAATDLASMCSSNPCGFDGSVYATALAARALLRASEFPALAFDTDGDGTADGSDWDADGDGFCDPGESGSGCTGSDAFPLDAIEHADLDHDGLGDAFADADDDGDGVADAAETLYATNALESRDSDADGTGDTADFDDDQDSVTDVEERLRGLDPFDDDSDNDSFTDGAEIAATTDPLDPGHYPEPDGDVHPLGDPDGIVDLRDALLAIRINAGLVTVSSEQKPVFDRHADVAPFDGSSPQPNGLFDGADALVILRRTNGSIAAW